ncbi:MAG: SufD family Fe-S cluster assembly protein [Patescibacteria group bacterium]
MKKQAVVIMAEPGKKELVVNFDKKGGEEEVLALILADQPGDYYLKILVDHKVGNTFGRVMVRGVAKNGARVRVEGMIKIDKGANGVDDFLEMRLLLLDDKSQAVAEPKLEIETNEVKASHAATVGKIDEEQVFYLTSRGITGKEAERLIVDGFLNQVVDKIEDRKVASKVGRIRL